MDLSQFKDNFVTKREFKPELVPIKSNFIHFGAVILDIEFFSSGNSFV